jgi:excisionase family DNA binding protein
VKVAIEVMTPADVAAAFGVDAKTVARWARAGKLDSFQTIGGHRRYYAAQIEAILTGSPVPSVTSIRAAK